VVCLLDGRLGGMTGWKVGEVGNVDVAEFGWWPW
jgi:hypothetical protein